MVVIEIDLVGYAVKGEGNGLSGLGAVDVVHKNDLSLLRHSTHLSGWRSPLSSEQIIGDNAKRKEN